jgi:hypothetical protein
MLVVFVVVVVLLVQDVMAIQSVVAEPPIPTVGLLGPYTDAYKEV